jgi:phosphatidylserine decarboxylase
MNAADRRFSDTRQSLFDMISRWSKCTSWLFYPIPHHSISRISLRLTRLRNRLVIPLVIRIFIRIFNVNMDEALEPDPAGYTNFNAFFTRALRPDVRPIAPEADVVVSPADGLISQMGNLRDERILQAKGQNYSVLELLGGSHPHSTIFQDGKFCTIYLSPRDYHRVHMPADGELDKMIYIPGRLFSVSSPSLENIPRLFSRNERVAAIFQTGKGPLALVLVGAINVAAIETVWSGLITPPPGKAIRSYQYRNSHHKIHLRRGQEMGRFNMGSTVILLFPPNVVDWDPQLCSGTSVKMGQRLGTLMSQPSMEDSPLKHDPREM